MFQDTANSCQLLTPDVGFHATAVHQPTADGCRKVYRLVDARLVDAQTNANRPVLSISLLLPCRCLL